MIVLPSHNEAEKIHKQLNKEAVAPIYKRLKDHYKCSGK